MLWTSVLSGSTDLTAKANKIKKHTVQDGSESRGGFYIRPFSLHFGSIWNAPLQVRQYCLCSPMLQSFEGVKRSFLRILRAYYISAHLYGGAKPSQTPKFSPRRPTSLARAFIYYFAAQMLQSFEGVKRALFQKCPLVWVRERSS